MARFAPPRDAPRVPLRGGHPAHAPVPNPCRHGRRATLDLYDTIDWWDDFNHFLNWGLLVAAFGQFLLRLPLEPLNVFGLAVGFGAVTAVLWELGEYFAFIRHSEELDTAYTDTLGDLALGLTGSVVAALVTSTILYRRRL